MIKAVAFDIDGTLYPFWQMKLALTKSYVSHPVAMSLFRYVRKNYRQVQDELNQKTFLEREASLIKDKCRNPVEVLRDKVYGTFSRSFSRLRLFNQVKPTLARLRMKGLKIAFLSDFPVNEKLRLLDLEGFADVALGAEETLYLKPHRKGFDMMVEALGVMPEEVLFIGDSYDKDVIGAQEAGLQAALVNQRKDYGCLQFRSWDELSIYLENIGKEL